VDITNAMPLTAYKWRPGAGVRSTKEVLPHVARDNYSMPALMGVSSPSSGEMACWVLGTEFATGCDGAWRPAKENENRGLGRMPDGSGEIEISHGASEAEQLFDPERA
jgi:hypothetical protein